MVFRGILIVTSGIKQNILGQRTHLLTTANHERIHVLSSYSRPSFELPRPFWSELIDFTYHMHSGVGVLHWHGFPPSSPTIHGRATICATINTALTINLIHSGLDG